MRRLEKYQGLRENMEHQGGKIMKKSVLALLIIMAGMSACPTVDNVSLTPDEQGTTVRAALLVMGIRTEVTMRDVNDNGVIDIYIEHLGKKELSDTKRIYIQSAVTGAIGGSAEKWEFDHDMVYLEIEGVVYEARIADCVKCTYVGREEIEACMDESWTEKE
jgi:hypothetical protein